MGNLGFKPLYRQVREQLTARIASGAWKAGAGVPSEQQIAAELGVSQGTVRKALDEMTADRLLVRRQGRGTFVATHDESRILFQFFKLQPDTGEPSFPESEVLLAVAGDATGEEAARLSLYAGEPIIRIDRVRSIKSVRCIVERIVLPAALFGGIEQGAIPNNLYETFARQYGVTVAGGDEHLKAVAAGPQEAAILGVAIGSPLLRIDRIAHAIGGGRVEWRISLCHTASIRYATELR